MTSRQDDSNTHLAQVIWEQTRRQGLVHLYTGNGKGKTTAALGLALRALGRDRKVVVIQFLKRTRTGEMVFAEKMRAPLTISQFGASRFATREEKQDVVDSGQTVERGWQVARELVAAGGHDLVILDEVTHVVKQKTVPLAQLIEMIKGKPPQLELVLTGRYAPPGLLVVCDYVTDMKEIKHPFHNGIRAREGTEY